ncbi:Y-family DNA polymerase [Novosphingobium terrae]|uniref:Y-family DNA polymerase n=1 Tax=Novosphingobium terrae TaxID=2726189 RepID=UPI00197EDFBD|nr:DNA polymerase Y family protein [Novosphingobium terrae]
MTPQAQQRSSPRRCLALWFPFLPCERVKRTAPPDADLPFALVARVGQALRLAALERDGASHGLAVGMTLADARARCPDLVTAPHDPPEDARLLAVLAGRMARFTPMVALDPPDGLVLDITGCAHLFGGEAALARLAISEAGLTTRPALASHAAAARALARFERGQAGGEEALRIRALPITALELPEASLSGLRRAGLKHLGDLASRPMGSLAARFGEEAVAKLRAILGEAGSPIVARARPVPIRADIRFAEPIGRTQDVLEVAEALLEDTARQMEARRLGGRRFVLRLERADGALRHLAVETALPTRDAAPVVRLLRERLENLADPLDPGFGFDAMALAVPRHEPLAARQTSSEAEDREEETIAALLDRLATRLGEGAILRLHPRDRHSPEKAQALVAAARGLPGATQAPALPRPLFLFDPPQEVSAIAGVPDGPPLRFTWRGRAHEVRLAEGPERIAPEWWRHAQGHLPETPLLTRDYYRVEDSAGYRFWLFRHGLFEEQTHPRWYLHGLFS